MKICKKNCFGRKLLLACGLFCCGFCVGIHRKVILALIKGTEMPEAPAWHFWCK